MCELPVGSFSNFACTLSVSQLQLLQSSAVYINVRTADREEGVVL
jgi:hypothetical protein